jgi:predicted Zn-dependent protease
LPRRQATSSSTAGLFAALDNEEELAGILAHEAAHALCRHISQNIERSKRLSMVSLAGIIAGVAFGRRRRRGAAAQAATIGSMAAGQSAQLAYSRENERQADEIGLKYLTSAGYGGMGLLTSLNKIRSKNWWNKDQVPTYLQTHPAAEDRIAYIDSWLQLHGGKPDAAGVPTSRPVDSKNFHRARNRLIALYGDADLALRQYRQAVAEEPGDPMSHYGYGLVLGRVGRRTEAIEQFRLALARQAFDPYILKDLGRIYFLDGNYADALRTLEGAEAMGANDPEATFYRGRTLMEMGRLDEALPVFEGLVQQYPGYDTAVFYLGTVYGELGNLGEAHYTLGLYYADKSDFRTARMQFEKALEHTDDPQKKAKIEGFLKKMGRQVEKERERQAEENG